MDLKDVRSSTGLDQKTCTLSPEVRLRQFFDLISMDLPSKITKGVIPARIHKSIGPDPGCLPKTDHKQTPFRQVVDPAESYGLTLHIDSLGTKLAACDFMRAITSRLASWCS